MARFQPPYPPPLDPSSKNSLWALFSRGRKSWLYTLYKGSYRGTLSRVRLPGIQLFLVKVPRLIRHVLIEKPEKFPKHISQTEILEPLLGESIFTTNGETWKRQRRMLDPAFEQARLKAVFPLMRDGVDALTARLDALEDGAVSDIDIEMTHVTADIILRTILSVSLDGEDARKIFHAFNLFQEKASLMMQLRIFRIPLWLAPFSWHRWRRSGREIRELLSKIIRKRYTAHQNGEPAKHEDILQSLIEMKDPEDGTPFTLKELVDQVAMLFLAGHETSASALSWSFYLIAKCPDLQEALYEESRAVTGERRPEFSDIAKHRHVRNVFRETLRLYPPVGFLSIRTSTESGCVMADKPVPAGSPVVVSPWLVHRHREIWKDPDDFDLARWEKSGEASRQPPCAYIPFGQGPRICIGAAFALQEAMLILAVLARRYRFETVSGHEPEPVARLTIRSENGMPLRVFHRPRQAEKAEQNPAA